MTFRERVKAEMKYLGISAKELAARAGISVNTLNMYIGYREAMPSCEVGLKIADALCVSLDYLVNGNNDKSSTEFSEKQKMHNDIFCLLSELNENQLKNYLQMTQLFVDSIKNVQ